jgi:hypothetical protein
MEMRNKQTAIAAVALLATAACLLAGAAAARPLEAPTVTGIGPTSGKVGTKVTIYGHFLYIDQTVPQVTFNGHGAGVVRMDPTDTHIIAYVPQGTPVGGGQVTVTTAEGTATAPMSFTVNPGGTPVRPPSTRIAGFSPLRGAAGTKVMIRGLALGGPKWVKIGGVKATFMVPSQKLIVAIVPKHARSGRIVVKTELGTATSRGMFTVLGAGV